MLNSLIDQPSIPIAIALGAVVGALSRYYVTLFWNRVAKHQFPYGTLFANMTGAFVIGFISQTIDGSLLFKKFAIVGFLGAYTTFSSYILDAANLLDDHRTIGIVYWLGSPILGLIAVQLGLACAQLMS
jgi:CrcB protein